MKTLIFVFGDQRIPDRIWDRFFVTPDGHWLWPGANTRGYGSVYWQGKTVILHRLMRSMIEELDPELTIEHKCKIPECCNPYCMEQITRGENTRRGDSPSIVSARTGMCKKGLHSMHDAYVKGDGTKQCRHCHYAYKIDRRAT